MANDKNHQTPAEHQRRPDVQPSESGRQTVDPGRTPGKAEGKDDSSATDAAQHRQDVENYEKTKEKKLDETATPNERGTF